MQGRTFANLASSLLLSFACGSAEEGAAPEAAVPGGADLRHVRRGGR